MKKIILLKLACVGFAVIASDTIYFEEWRVNVAGTEENHKEDAVAAVSVLNGLDIVDKQKSVKD